MRLLRPVLPALAFVASLVWATQVSACDKTGAASAASTKMTCTADMAAKCTPEMMAACQAKGARAASAAHCPGILGVAMTASMDHCTGMGAKAASAGDHCAGMGAKAASAGDHCASMGTAAAAAGALPSKTKMTGQCSGHGMESSAARMSDADCDACADMVQCDGELQGVGARVQMVPLKNGVMFVYSAASPGKVTQVQSAMARRTERLNQIVTAGDKAHLCADCKSMRGAMASGKLNREVVNIEGGALALMTSSDPAMVAKIHSMLDVNRLAHKI